jgi:hypothetical protein
MSRLRKHGKLVIAILCALSLLAVWTCLSFVSISNKQNVSISYLIQEPTGQQSRGVLGPGESRYVRKFLSEGGLRVQAISGGVRKCDVNVYTVPPLGAKCEVSLTPSANTCACRLGL